MSLKTFLGAWVLFYTIDLILWLRERHRGNFYTAWWSCLPLSGFVLTFRRKP